jgi:hypothetical protein
MLTKGCYQRIEDNCPGWATMTVQELAVVLDRLIHENITFRNTTASAAQTSDQLLGLLRKHKAVSVPKVSQ